MTDLNLDFDVDTKNIALTNGLNDNLSINQETDKSFFNDINTNTFTEPNLRVSDISGVELLAKGVSSERKSDGYSSGPESEKDEGFSFFKKIDEKGGLVDDTVKETSPQVEDEIFLQKDDRSDNMSDYKPIHKLSPQEIKNEKIDFLYKFKKLESQGIRTTMNYNMNSHLDDMRNEYIKLKKQREIENSVKFQRKMLMACITGMEFLNNRFDPFNIKLDGWSESVNEDINDYDEVFEELSTKYGGGSDMAPEFRLLLSLAGSAFMFHLTNTMFKSSIPGMDDVLRQNPELMQQFAEAAVGSMNNPGASRMPQASNAPPPQQRGGGNPLGGLMGGLMGGGGGDNPLAAMMGGGGDNPLAAMMGGGGSSGPPRRPGSPERPEMNGPDGLDDLINKMNLQPNKIPDLDNISLMSNDSDNKSGQGGITLNL